MLVELSVCLSLVACTAYSSQSQGSLAGRVQSAEFEVSDHAMLVGLSI